MPVPPRVLLSIDYEPVFALFRHYDRLTDPEQRRDLDRGFTCDAIDPILEQLGDSKASIYLVARLRNGIPKSLKRSLPPGHELGLHCHIHRPLINVHELAEDLRASASWCKQYGVRGYRAPMVGISEAAYQLLGECGLFLQLFHLCAGRNILQKGDVWEIPVSTLRLHEKTECILRRAISPLKLAVQRRDFHTGPVSALD